MNNPVKIENEEGVPASRGDATNPPPTANEDGEEKTQKIRFPTNDKSIECKGDLLERAMQVLLAWGANERFD